MTAKDSHETTFDDSEPELWKRVICLTTLVILSPIIVPAYFVFSYLDKKYDITCP